MDSFKDWLVLICVVSVAGAVIEAAVPKSKSKKAFGYLSAAVVIYVFLLPLHGGNLPEFDIEKYIKQNSDASESFEESSEQTMLRAAQEGYESVIEETLLQDEIVFSKLSVQCEEKNDSIAVKSVEIYANLNDSQKLICKNKIEKICKDLPEIIFYGSESGD